MLTLRKRHQTFGGWTEFYTHASQVIGAPMNFAVFQPPQVAEGVRVPVVYWLSGLTCSEENFMAKAGAQRYAAEHGLMLVTMDTSPRVNPKPSDEPWWFGVGAGFYVNATEEPWRTHYRMFDYVADELPDLIRRHFYCRPDAQSIMGHSMGGHGALVLALSRPEAYRAVSAFAPIAAASRCAWGRYAFERYLGASDWQRYDAAALLAAAGTTRPPLLVDQGRADEFLHEGQLTPALLEAAAAASGYPMELRYREGYDHSYYFVASFIEEHLAFHRRHLD